MRGINLPPLPRPPSDVEDCSTLYLSRLERGMPFPAASLLLVAYMAWPNNEAEQNGWIATSTAFFAARQAESTRAELITHAATAGDVHFEADDATAVARIRDILQLIVSMREYQLA